MDKETMQELQDSYTYHFFFNHGVYDELKHYEDLIIETELFLKMKIVAMENSVDEDIVDVRFGRKVQYEEIFPMILWKSLFLSTYFLLENSLDQISKNLRNSNSYKLSIKDITGLGIYRSSLYLKKVCGIVEPFQSESWLRITDFNKIRNVLVHSDGIFQKSNVELIKVCSKYDQLTLLEYDEDELSIEFNHSFCRYSLSIIENLIQEIHKTMIAVRASH